MGLSISCILYRSEALFKLLMDVCLICWGIWLADMLATPERTNSWRLDARVGSTVLPPSCFIHSCCCHFEPSFSLQLSIPLAVALHVAVFSSLRVGFCCMFHVPTKAYTFPWITWALQSHPWLSLFLLLSFIVVVGKNCICQSLCSHLVSVMLACHIIHFRLCLHSLSSCAFFTLLYSLVSLWWHE